MKIESINMPWFQDSGKSRGYAHVVFENEDDFNKALEKSGVNLGGRRIDI